MKVRKRLAIKKSFATSNFFINKIYPANEKNNVAGEQLSYLELNKPIYCTFTNGRHRVAQSILQATVIQTRRKLPLCQVMVWLPAA